MKHCTRCVMPDTRPGITFNDEGICSACLAYEKRKQINWEERLNELKAFCGYTEREFWQIIDRWYNRELFEKDSFGRWSLKRALWENKSV